MEKYEDIEIGERYKLPQGETVWITALQDNFITNRDMIVKVTDTAFDKNSIFGVIQIVFVNYPMQFLIGEAAKVYSDKTHGEIHINYKQLQSLK